jgi:hypothetical protein
MKYRKKPVVVDAIQYSGENNEEVALFIGHWMVDEQSGNPIITTMDGSMEALPFDYIIKGVKGEFYPCKPDIFKMTYEEVV